MSEWTVSDASRQVLERVAQRTHRFDLGVWLWSDEIAYDCPQMEASHHDLASDAEVKARIAREGACSMLGSP